VHPSRENQRRFSCQRGCSPKEIPLIRSFGSGIQNSLVRVTGPPAAKILLISKWVEVMRKGSRSQTPRLSPWLWLRQGRERHVSCQPGHKVWDIDALPIRYRESRFNGGTLKSDCLFLDPSRVVWHEKSAIDTLPPREREVLKMRFGLEDGWPLTVNEVSPYFNCSESQIVQIETRA